MSALAPPGDQRLLRIVMEIFTGYVVFRWIATWANPFGDILFRTFTDLGSHTVYYVALAPLFWAVDRRRAAVLLLLVLASGYVNTFAKLAVHSTRPNPALARVMDPSLYQSGNGAFPSGHAQNAVVVWAYLATWVAQRWFSIVAVIMVLLISFSRLYLGVHFPIDIVGGLAIGAVLTWKLPVWLETWAESGFRLDLTASLAVVGGSALVTLATRDLTLAMISGSLVGFLASVAWLPQATLQFGSRAEAVLGVAVGLVLLILLSAVLEPLPRQPAVLYLQVAVLWVAALWAYPQALRRIWLGRRVVAGQSE
jgi:membrane-associated phospholipid phosphatase